MQIVFSEHASRQLKERNLAVREIEKTVFKPAKLIQQLNKRYRAVRPVRRRGKNYLLVVLYDRKNSTAEIVTSFLTSKVKKYL